MRHTAALLALVCALSAAPAAADKPAGRIITVHGTGEVDIEPDEAVLTLVIDKFDPALDTAKRINDETVEKLLALLRRYSIPARDIQTSHVSMEIVREQASKTHYPEYGAARLAGEIRGYAVSKRMVVRLGDLNRFEDLYAEILKSGASEVESVLLGTSKVREHRETARTLALNAAREKASAMAGTLGQTIGKAVEIVEDPSRSVAYTSNNAGSYSNSSTTVGGFAEETSLFSPGEIQVITSVTVSFELD